MNKLLNLSSEKIKICVLNLISSFLFSSAFMLTTTDTYLLTLEYAKDIDAFALILLTLGVFAILSLIESVFTLKGKPALFSSFLAAFIFIASAGDNFYFTLAVCVLLIFFIMFLEKEKLIEFSFSFKKKEVNILVTLAFVTVSFITAYACVCRFLSYRSSNFDMGIFSQMFEYMVSTGKMLTTSERNKLMSHLGVHFSPILYALLPFYTVFRTPAFLAAVQPFIVLSGVFPFLLLMRKKGKSEKSVLAYSLIFIIFPAFLAPCYYDFHENIFFAPLIMWLLYFIEKDNRIGIAAFMLLTFLVKEEAGLYVASIGLYVLFGKKKVKLGLALIFISIAHFIAATSLINFIGDGTLMAGHYYNLIPDGESGMFSMIKTILVSPGYTVSQLLSEEKIIYIVYMFLPLGFLPMKTKKYSLYFLLIPMLLMNIIIDYHYQYDICYQYSFGSGALLFYMCAENCEADLKNKKSAFVYLMVCVLLCSNITLVKSSSNIVSYYTCQSQITATDDVINEIPADASVSASTFLIPKLYKVKNLYMLNGDEIFTDYVLIDMRYEEEAAEIEIECLQNGYAQVANQGFVKVYFHENG